MSVRRLMCYVIAGGGTLKMSNAINRSLLRIWNIKKQNFMISVLVTRINVGVECTFRMKLKQ